MNGSERYAKLEDRVRGALYDLTDGAEAWAREQGIEFRWEDDWNIGDHAAEFDCYEDGGPDTCEMCAAYLGDTLLACLGCIDDASDECRRLVEADLAIEARAELHKMLVAAL